MRLLLDLLLLNLFIWESSSLLNLRLEFLFLLFFYLLIDWSNLLSLCGGFSSLGGLTCFRSNSLLMIVLMSMILIVCHGNLGRFSNSARFLWSRLNSIFLSRSLGGLSSSSRRRLLSSIVNNRSSSSFIGVTARNLCLLNLRLVLRMRLRLSYDRRYFSRRANSQILVYSFSWMSRLIRTFFLHFGSSGCSSRSYLSLFGLSFFNSFRGFLFNNLFSLMLFSSCISMGMGMSMRVIMSVVVVMVVLSVAMIMTVLILLVMFSLVGFDSSLLMSFYLRLNFLLLFRLLLNDLIYFSLTNINEFLLFLNNLAAIFVRNISFAILALLMLLACVLLSALWLLFISIIAFVSVISFLVAVVVSFNFLQILFLFLSSVLSLLLNFNSIILLSLVFFSLLSVILVIQSVSSFLSLLRILLGSQVRVNSIISLLTYLFSFPFRVLWLLWTSRLILPFESLIFEETFVLNFDVSFSDLEVEAKFLCNIPNTENL